MSVRRSASSLSFSGLTSCRVAGLGRPRPSLPLALGTTPLPATNWHENINRSNGLERLSRMPVPSSPLSSSFLRGPPCRVTCVGGKVTRIPCPPRPPAPRRACLLPPVRFPKEAASSSRKIDGRAQKRTGTSRIESSSSRLCIDGDRSARRKREERWGASVVSPGGSRVRCPSLSNEWDRVPNYPWRSLSRAAVRRIRKETRGTGYLTFPGERGSFLLENSDPTTAGAELILLVREAD